MSEKKGPGQSGVGLGMLVLMAFAGLALFGVVTLLLSATGLVTGDAAGGLACILLVVGGFASLWAWARLARSAFGEAHLEVLGPIHPGGTIELMLVLEPRRPLTVSPADCSVLINAANASGESAISLLNERHPLALPPRLEQRLEHRVVLPTPDRLPVTDEDVTASVIVTVGVQGWPDLQLSRKLTVRPKPG